MLEGRVPVWRNGSREQPTMASEAVVPCSWFELLRVAGRCVQVHSLVLPAGRIVTVAFRIPAGEEPVQIFGVLEVVADDGGRIGVGDDVLPEQVVVLADVVDDAAQKSDVTAGPDWHVATRVGAGPRESGIDVND